MVWFSRFVFGGFRLVWGVLLVPVMWLVGCCGLVVVYLVSGFAFRVFGCGFLACFCVIVGLMMGWCCCLCWLGCDCPASLCLLCWF